MQADVLDAAIAEAHERGYLGDDILGSGFGCSLVLHRGAGAYICGEETGLLDSLEGKRGNPRLKPPFPANQGLFQGPTLINNVETLATLPHIVELGADEYAAIGVRELCRHEAGLGQRQRAATGQLRDRARHQEPRDHLRPRGRAAGGSRGQAVVPRRLVLAGSDEGRSRPRVRLRHDGQGRARCSARARSSSSTTPSRSSMSCLKLAKFYAHESCGKCTPCREGTSWTVKMLERIHDGSATPMDLDIMASVQEQHHRATASACWATRWRCPSAR